MAAAFKLFCRVLTYYCALQTKWLLSCIDACKLTTGKEFYTLQNLGLNFVPKKRHMILYYRTLMRGHTECNELPNVIQLYFVFPCYNEETKASGEPICRVGRLWRSTVSISS